MIRKITAALVFVLVSFSLLMAQVGHEDLQARVRDSATSALNSYFEFMESGSILDLVEGVSYSARTKAYLDLIFEMEASELDVDKLNLVINGFSRLSDDIAKGFAADPEIVKNDVGFVTYLTIIKVKMEDLFGELSGMRY